MSEFHDRKVARAFRDGLMTGAVIGILIGVALSGVFDAIGWAW